MKLSDKIGMSLEDLKKRKFRTFLTVFSMAIGAMLIIDMFGMGQGMQDLINKKLLEHANLKSVMIYTGNNSKAKKVMDDYLKKLDKLNEKASLVASIETEVTKVKIGDKEKDSSQVVGVNTDYDVVVNAEKEGTKPNVAGRLFSKGEKNVVLVGRKYLQYMGIKDYKSVVGKNATLTVKLPKIAGVISKEPLNINAKIVGVLDNKCNNAEDIVCSSEIVEKVQEKTKWIGIMKALGASRKDIKSIFIVQSGVMGFFGAVFGSLIALITSGIINEYAVSSLKSLVHGGFGEIDSVLNIQISTILVCIGFTVLVAMLAGLRPAAKAARLEPVETLSYE